MTRHRTHSIEFKHQESQAYLAGETLHDLAKRHDLARNLIRIWVAKYESGLMGLRLPQLLMGRFEEALLRLWHSDPLCSHSLVLRAAGSPRD